MDKSKKLSGLSAKSLYTNQSGKGSSAITGLRYKGSKADTAGNKSVTSLNAKSVSDKARP